MSQGSVVEEEAGTPLRMGSRRRESLRDEAARRAPLPLALAGASSTRHGASGAPR